MIDLAATRAAMREQDVATWCLYDFRGSNPVLWHVLGCEPRGTTRRLWLVIGLDGDPVLIASVLDRHVVGDLGVPVVEYRRWEEMTDELRARVHGRTAMEYSPGGLLPAVSWADAGAVEFVRALGAEVVSSGDLFQAVAAAWDADAEASHHEAVRHVVEVRDLAFAAAREGLGRTTEREVAALILDQFARRGLEVEGTPAVATGPRSGDPHAEPTDATIMPDEVLLIDLWARLPGERNVFGDVTWMGYTGSAPPDEVGRVFDAVRAGRDAALALLRERSDLRGYEVDRVTREAIEAAGYGHGIVHRTGHSLGPGPRVHGLGANLDDWETRDDRRLLPGTGFTIEPGVYLPAFGVRLECDVHLHPQRGPVVTTPLQTELSLLT